MLTHSPPKGPNTLSQSNPVPLDAHFNPYVPTPDSVKDEGFAKAVIPPPKRSRFEGITNFYGAITRMCGFNEKYSLGLCACKTLILPTSLLPLQRFSLGVLSSDSVSQGP